MKYLLLILLLFYTQTAQSQMLENPSFEDWETENGKAEPVNWSSIQTSIPQQMANVAPQTMKQSDLDPHSGNYCIRLENISTFGIIATGTITNGRFYANLNRELGYGFTDPTDPRWNTPITGRPDSIVFWYKFTPPVAGIDFPTIKVLLHLDSAKIPNPDSTNYIAFINENLPSTPQMTWRRASFPFKYQSTALPEYILLLLTSGNGTEAVEGSVAYYDDIELIYNSTNIDDNEVSESVEVFGLNNRIKITMSNSVIENYFNLKIYNIIGREIYSGTIYGGKSMLIDNILPGVYFCVFTGNDGETVFKKTLVK